MSAHVWTVSAHPGFLRRSTTLRPNMTLMADNPPAVRSTQAAYNVANQAGEGARLLRATVIEWDGTHLPKELQQLPPGRYLLAVPDDGDELSAEEDAAIRLGLDDLTAGR